MAQTTLAVSRSIALVEASKQVEKTTTVDHSPTEELARAIKAVQRVYQDRKWNRWADRWLSGRDRSSESALKAFIVADREFDRLFIAYSSKPREELLYQYQAAYAATWVARAAFSEHPEHWVKHALLQLESLQLKKSFGSDAIAADVNGGNTKEASGHCRMRATTPHILRGACSADREKRGTVVE